jgi:putative membrane protein
VSPPTDLLVALPPLSGPGLLTHYALDPVVLLAVVGAGFWYLRGLRRLPRQRHGLTWPRRRTASFLAGLVVTAWVSCGSLQVYYPSLFWVWTAQILTLLLVAPILLVAGQPVELDRRLGGGVVSRIVASPVAGLIANPFVGPALIPVLGALLFFGPLPGWAVQSAPLAWAVAVLVTVIGAIIVLPVLDVREVRASVVVGLAMGIGFFELLLDAILDLPFLVVLFFRWYRTDVREANDVDAVLDAEQIVRSAQVRPGAVDEASPDAVDPWWLTDPVMRERMRRNRS